MAWPAPLPGRLLEAVGNRGPRGMTVTGRKLRTEPGLQAGFANFQRFPAGICRPTVPVWRKVLFVVAVVALRDDLGHLRSVHDEPVP